jgi:hypothetical protein
MKSVGRHLVTLSCVQRAPGSSVEKAFVFSGFLIEAGGLWFYVTAGHILRDIRIALAQGATFDIWRLGDQTAGNAFQDTAIPFDFNIDHWSVIEDEALGMDYAATVLDGLYCRQLEAGGASPISKGAWSDYVTEHDSWALVGIPSESVSYDGESLIRARVVVAPLEPTDAPSQAGLKATNQFFARLKDDTAGILKDVDGMSGGPVFALKKFEGKWRYSVIGVQSGWYKQLRVIAACPITSFALALENIVLESRALIKKGESMT